MNYSNEILCVNEENEVEVKHIDKILPKDKIMFKVLDINNPRSARLLKLG